ncbi:MAG: hypothetical protein DSY91_01985 [Deltaproteobacteria bacterium]|nr:MAG: hypothetical protein DSY91_01985 [Deltaproteobacteria bacterium]
MVNKSITAHLFKRYPYTLSFFNTILIFVVLFILFCIPVSGKECPQLVTKAEINNFCTQLSKAERGRVSQVAETIRAKIQARTTLGQRRVPPEMQKCHELIGRQIKLFCEDASGVLVDQFVSDGQTNGSNPVSVYACQLGERGDSSEKYTEVSVQLFWRNCDVSSIHLQPDHKQIAWGDTASVQARLECGPCVVKGEQVHFSCKTAGDVFPKEARTNADGIASTSFTMRREEPVKITAESGGKHTATAILPVWTPWSVEITLLINLKECDDGRDVYRAHAEYKVQIDNLLLAQAVDNARRAAKSEVLGKDPFRFLWLLKPATNQGHLRGYEEHLKCPHEGPCFWKRLNFDKETSANFYVGLLLNGEIPHRKARPGVLGFGVNVNPPIILYTPHGPYRFFGVNPREPTQVEFEREFLKTPVLPFDDILEHRPINRTERVIRKFDNGGSGTWDYSYRFKPKQ